MYLVAFPQKSEYEKMRTRLERISLAYDVVNPEPGYGLVGIPAIAMEQEKSKKRCRRCEAYV
jgi:hypothetical protein